MGRKEKRVLVLAIRAIGDVVLITPILRLLKQRVPASYLAVLADGPSAEVLRHNPHVDRIVAINRSASRKLPRYHRLWNTLSLLKDLRAERFDIAVDLFSGPRSACIAWACGARDRYGEEFRTRGRGFLYNHPVRVIRDDRHLIEQKIALISSFVNHVETHETELEVAVTEEEHKQARAMLARYGVASPRLVGLIPGAGSVFRQWPPDRFAAIGDRLVEDYNAKVLLFGSHEDASVCRRVAELMRHKPVDLSGMTTLRELIALFSELDLVVSNVTGPMHLAVALNQPKVIALYGAADTVQYAPCGTTGVMLTKGRPNEAYWWKVDYRRDYEEFLLQIAVLDVLDQIRFLMPEWQGKGASNLNE